MTVNAGNFQATKFMPSLALRATPIVATLGDSRTAFGYSVPATNTYRRAANSYQQWIEFLTYGRVRCPGSMTFGTSGYTTAQIKAEHYPNALASAADIVVMLCGTNDTAGTFSTTAYDNASDMAKGLADSGKIVILIPELPRGSSGAFGGTFLQDFMNYQQLLRELGSYPGVYIADPSFRMTDLTQAGNFMASGMAYDGLHQTVYGAYTIARSVVDIINTLIPLNSGTLSGNPSDIYDPVYFPRGNINTLGGGMLGTGGTLSVATGAAASNYQLTTTNADFAVVGSLVNSAFTGRRMQQVAATAGAPVGAIRQAYVNCNLLRVNFIPGEIYEAYVECEIDAGASNVCMPRIDLSVQVDGGTESTSGMYIDATTTNFPAPPVAVQGILKTPPFRLTGRGGQKQITSVPFSRVTALIPNGQTGGLTYRIGAFHIRRILDDSVL